MSLVSKPQTNNKHDEQQPYHAPTLTDYGKMSELTQTITGDTGDDNGAIPSSYTAST